LRRDGVVAAFMAAGGWRLIGGHAFLLSWRFGDRAMSRL